MHHQKQLGGKLIHSWRYRYELRWQEQFSSDDYRFFTRWRMRYRLRYIYKGDNFQQKNMMYITASNELAINIGNNIPYNFNQSRWHFGMGIRLNNAMRLEASYVDVYRARGADGNIYDRGQGLILGIFIDQLTNAVKRNSFSSTL